MQDSIVDIIVPLYRGLHQTQRCLHALLKHPQYTPWELILINDRTPDPQLHQFLREFARRDPRITLIEHSENQGFVRSINEGIQLHPERDLVLLNSDTEVHGDWLDRLRACALAEPGICTVTPFSNRATLCSYPKIGAENPLPEDLARLDALFRAKGAGQWFEIPTGVGFCLYVRRNCLQAVGPFDAETFGVGYGEEVDFCQRAKALGYRHVLCGDTFVYHEGAVSFGTARQSRIERAQTIIDARYPEYAQSVQDFFARDPARKLKRTVDLARLGQSPKPRVLFISHGWGGGVQQHLDVLVRLFGNALEPLLLQPLGDRIHRLHWAHPDEAFALYFDLHEESEALISVLRSLGLARIHYHHMQGFPPNILDLPEILGVPFWCTFHDYFPLCPQYHLGGTQGTYCKEPDASVCQACLEERPHPWHWDIQTWRQRFACFLGRAERLIAPSRDVADRLHRFFPDLPVSVLPHPEPRGQAIFSPDYRKIAILGHTDFHKGLKTLFACAREARARNHPLHFRILGTCSAPIPKDLRPYLSFTGEYAPEALAALIQQERPDAFFFAASVPETYSYTLSAAKRTGLPIVATELGAFPERLSDYPQAQLLPLDTDAETWNLRFLALPAGFSPAEDRQPVLPDPDLPERYFQQYLEGLTSHPPDTAPPDLSEDRCRFPEARRPPPPPLETLISAALEQGRWEAAEQLPRSVRALVKRSEQQAQQIADLRAQVAAREAQIAQLEDLIADQGRQLREGAQQRDRLSEEVGELKRALRDYDLAHHRHVRHLERTVAALRAQVREFEESQFWKLTYPLRLLTQQSRDALRSAQAFGRQLPHRVQRARRLLQEGGMSALAQAWQARRRARTAQSTPPPLVLSQEELAQKQRCHPLKLPRAAKPQVSILLPTYGQHGVTFACLESIAQHTPDIPLEILLMDDAFPGEPAQAALAAVENLRIHRNEENLGFLKTCNRAAELANGEFLVFLNNDTLVQPGWLEALLSAFRSRPHVGAVGAKLLFPNGTLQEAGGIVWRDGSAWNFGRGEDPNHPRFNYVREVDYCSGACLLIPRQRFLELGGFDERFSPAYYEDTDLCFQLQEQGDRVLYQPQAAIVHLEGISHGTDESTGIKAYQQRNRQRFLEKWAARLAQHEENGVQPERARDRNARCRILWIEACMLTPDQDSGSLRTWRLLQLLRQMEVKVSFVADNLEYRAPYVGELQQQGIEVLYAPYITSVTQYLREQLAQYDAVVLCRHYIAIQYVDLIRRIAPQVYILFDTIDLHFLRLRRQAALDGSAKTRQLAKQAYEEEMTVIARSDLTLVVSEVERDLLARECPKARVQVLSNVHDPVEPVKPFASRKNLLFVGGFQHPPNVDAVQFFAEEIWPQVRAQLPEVQAQIIGSKMPADLRAYGQRAGLNMLGYVEDLQPYLEGCRISIAPLRYGAGVKGKVNQSMSYGLPVVATPAAVEGMFLRHGENVLIAESGDAFAREILRLYEDADLWNRLSQAGLENVRTRFSSETARRRLLEIFSSLGL